MGGKSKDLTGKRFGRIVVLKKMCERKNKYHVYLCECDCGRKVYRSTTDLMRTLKRSGVYSCGHCTYSNSILGIKGVCLSASKRFESYVYYQGKTYYLGSKDDLFAALELRNQAQAHIDFEDFPEWLEKYKQEVDDRKHGNNIEKRPEESDKEFVIRAREMGMTFQSIADKIGVTRQRVHQIYKKETKEMTR